MEKVIDEPDVEVRGRFGVVGHCRVQILRAEDCAVVVLTQRLGADDGWSVTNGAEAFAAAVRDRFPLGDPERVVFIQHYVGDADDDWTSGGHGGLLLVSFDGSGRPSWSAVPADLQEMLHRYADAGRGNPTRRVAAAPPSTDRWVALPFTALPRPIALFRERCMKPGALRTVNRVLQQKGQRRLCRCWYHAGDWSTATTAAIEALSRAHDGAPDLNDVDAIAGRAVDLLPATLTGSWVEAAAWSLLSVPIVPADHLTDYNNGQHRSEAMIDQRVAWIPVVLPTPDDRPAAARLLG